MKDKLCEECKDQFPHKEHQRCYSCGIRVAVPLNSSFYTNSTLCKKCHDNRVFIDENGKITIKVETF